MNRLFRFLSLALLLTAAPAATAANFTRGTETAVKFGVHEISLTGNGGVANPHDTIATVTFTPASGSEKSVTVLAFHDGGDTWRARVYVSETGTWTWSSSSADSGLDGKDGVFEAADSDLPGKLVKHPEDPKAWATDDGNWFLNISDTAYYLFHEASSDWQQFVSDSAGQGVTSVRSNVAGALRQHEKQKDSDGWDRIFNDATRDTPDTAAFQEQDARMEWMLNNHPGMYLQLIVTPEPSRGWGQDEDFWVALGETQRSRYLRYVVARYAAFPQVFWLVTNDAFHGPSFPNNNAMVSEIGAYLAANDPWKDQNLRSSGRNRDQPFHFTSEPWASYIHLETSLALSADQVDAYKDVPMHVFNGEDWYEGEKDIPNGAYFFRRLLWAWTLSGGSANYGGEWNKIVPYSATGFTGLDGIIHMKNFFAENGIGLAGFVPDDARAAGPANQKRVKLMRKADDTEFVIYHPNAAADGGAAALDPGTPILTLKDLPARTYALTWLRAEDGAVVRSVAFAHTGGDRELAAPWAGADVVAWLRPHIPVKIIFDTDYTTDCDDPGALAILHALADNGEVEILATAASTRHAKAPGAIDVVNTYYNRPDLPISATKVGPTHNSNFVDFLYDNFPHNTPLSAQVEDTVISYRKILASQPDDSVIIATVGYLTNVAELLKSQPDEHSPLNGHDLIVAKVKEWACMGGNFWSGSTDNVNFSRDAASASYAIHNFPKKLTFMPREVASVPSPLRAGEELNETPITNPVRIAYHKYFGRTTNIDRHCADLATVLYAARGIHDYWDLETQGSMTQVNANGTFIWDSASGKDHNYVKMKGGLGVYSNKQYVENTLRDLLKKAPGAVTVPSAPTPPPPPPPAPTPVDGLIAWYRFEEAPGAADPGTPIANHGDAGAALDLTDTGGPDGRNNTGGGGYQAPGAEGFGHAFDILASGDGTYHSGSGGIPTGGGLLTSGGVAQSALQGSDGAFTYEALIRLAATTAEQTILAHDGTDVRGFLFRVNQGQLSFYNGNNSSTAPIPTTGTHAFQPDKWFHVAVTYTGAETVSGNLRFYWTALGASPSPVQAHEIGSATMTNDLPTSNNLLGVGTTTRSPKRFELAGLIDEVRISGFAHAPNTFAIFAPPSNGPADTSGDGIPDNWAIARGLDPGADNTAADPDRNGIPALIEFALALEPGTPGLASLPAAGPLNGYLTLSIDRNPEAAHLLFQPEVSADLAVWHSGPAHLTILEDTPSRLVARDNSPFPGPGGRFMRLKVEKAQP